jgi:hypothetical protein
MRRLSIPCLFLLVLLPLSVFTPVAWAWSALGHSIVGELAGRHLTPAAKAEVDALLAGEPNPSLAGVSSWPDALRTTDPARFKQTEKWHYVKLEPGNCAYVPENDCPDGNCVVGAIEAQRRILADATQSRDARRDALKFLVHFVGDAHQPMHASNRDDKGGNNYQLSLRTNLPPEAYAKSRYADGVMGSNMHMVWDYYILGEQRLDARHYADRLDAMAWPPTSGPDASSILPAAWASESCRLIDSRHLYPEGHVLDRSYLDTERPLAEQRIRQAAYRLAVLLNDALDPGHH